MWDAAKAGRWDEARALHFKIQALTELLFAEPSPAPTKAAMALLAEAGGSVQMGEEIREPLYVASPALREKIRVTMKESGLL